MKSLWFGGVFLLILVGGGLFHIKYQVAQVAEQLKLVQRKKEELKQTLHLLRAEWAYLNEPERLESLGKKYLDLKPSEPGQIISGSDLGFDLDALGDS